MIKKLTKLKSVKYIKGVDLSKVAEGSLKSFLTNNIISDCTDVSTEILENTLGCDIILDDSIIRSRIGDKIKKVIEDILYDYNEEFYDITDVKKELRSLAIHHICNYAGALTLDIKDYKDQINMMVNEEISEECLIRDMLNDMPIKEYALSNRDGKLILAICKFSKLRKSSVFDMDDSDIITDENIVLYKRIRKMLKAKKKDLYNNKAAVAIDTIEI